MRKSYRKLFNDKNKLSKLIKLRENGWSQKDLAIRFKCDVSSISIQIKKNNIKIKNMSTVTKKKIMKETGISYKKYCETSLKLSKSRRPTEIAAEAKIRGIETNPYYKTIKHTIIVKNVISQEL